MPLEVPAPAAPYVADLCAIFRAALHLPSGHRGLLSACYCRAADSAALLPRQAVRSKQIWPNLMPDSRAINAWAK